MKTKKATIQDLEWVNKQYKKVNFFHPKRYFKYMTALTGYLSLSTLIQILSNFHYQ